MLKAYTHTHTHRGRGETHMFRMTYVKSCQTLLPTRHILASLIGVGARVCVCVCGVGVCVGVCACVVAVWVLCVVVKNIAGLCMPLSPCSLSHVVALIVNRSNM